jgi:hypothetical protein
MPVKAEKTPMVTNADAKIARGNFGTRPVYKYSKITGIPIKKPLKIKDIAKIAPC